MSSFLVRFGVAGVAVLGVCASLSPLAGQTTADIPVRCAASALPPGWPEEAASRIDSVIVTAIRDGATPGAALAVGWHGRTVRLCGYGRLSWESDAPAVTDSTLYDVASLTKVVVTTPLAMRLVDQGRLRLDAAVSKYLPWWPRRGQRGRVRVRQLLEHTSGLPAGADLEERADSRRGRVRSVARVPLVALPGTEREYSDLGMVVLGAAIERLTAARLDEAARQAIFEPMGMRDSRFFPGDRPDLRQRYLGRIAPTEVSANGVEIRGSVHDPIASSLGGVAGNAGLFSSARDLGIYAGTILQLARGSRPKRSPVHASVVQRFVERRANRPLLGWESMTDTATSSAGHFFGPRSFGHTGYTGTSLWVDPDADLYVVLLTNRVHPSAANQKHKTLRRSLHDVVHLAANEAARRVADSRSSAEVPQHPRDTSTASRRTLPHHEESKRSGPDAVTARRPRVP